MQAQCCLHNVTRLSAALGAARDGSQQRPSRRQGWLEHHSSPSHVQSIPHLSHRSGGELPHQQSHTRTTHSRRTLPTYASVMAEWYSTRQWPVLLAARTVACESGSPASPSCSGAGWAPLAPLACRDADLTPSAMCCASTSTWDSPAAGLPSSLLPTTSGVLPDGESYSTSSSKPQPADWLAMDPLPRLRFVIPDDLPPPPRPPPPRTAAAAATAAMSISSSGWRRRSSASASLYASRLS